MSWNWDNEIEMKLRTDNLVAQGPVIPTIRDESWHRLSEDIQSCVSGQQMRPNLAGMHDH